jgi:nucleoside phosphorylase
MPLIISPKTYSQTVKTIVDHFKASKSEADFWHSNFKDYFFRAKHHEKELFFLFTGYSELSVSCGVIYAYDKLLRKLDNDQRAIYIGSCFSTAQTEADLGDIVIPDSAVSDCTVAMDIAERTRKIRPDEDVWSFDGKMREKLKISARRRGIKVYEGKILCKETYFEDFWFPFGEDWGYKKGYIAGEVETAAFAVSCHYIGIPCVALVFVKDKKKGEYKIASQEKQMEALNNILTLIDDLLRD